jgi:hypothetical protein
MIWIVFASTLALLGGLAGWTSGGATSALAFTIVGAAIALSVRDIKRHNHSIMGLTIITTTIGCQYAGIEYGIVLGILSVAVQISINEFVQRQSPVLPVSLGFTFLAWWLGWHYVSEMAGLIFALLAFLVQVAVHDFFIDSRHAIRRNFPLIGWCRYGLELIGDGAEAVLVYERHRGAPYNRITRSYIYRSAKGINNNLGFGTQRKLPRGRRDSRVASDVSHLRHRASGQSPAAAHHRTKASHALPLRLADQHLGHELGCAVRRSCACPFERRQAGQHSHATGEGGLTPFHLDGVVTRVSRLR